MSEFAVSLRPDAGRAVVGGLDVVTQAAVVRRVIGLAGQFAAVDPNLTGRENLRAGIAAEFARRGTAVAVHGHRRRRRGRTRLTIPGQGVRSWQ